jgi:hypothetical protein
MHTRTRIVRVLPAKGKRASHFEWSLATGCRLTRAEECGDIWRRNAADRAPAMYLGVIFTYD